MEHLIARNYQGEIDPSLPFEDQVVELARLFRGRLTALVANWIRVGYCQGNFNSDNCAAGGFTLDYGPFGFCELFDLRFQPWTGGGEHFCFFNQPSAAEVNYQMFWKSLKPLLAHDTEAEARLDEVRDGFGDAMADAINAMWASKLGLATPDPELANDLLGLMLSSKLDYTIFFRRLSDIPDDIDALKESFYSESSEQLDAKWSQWLKRWREVLKSQGDLSQASASMKQANPAITWREWLIAPAYNQAAEGDSTLINELQQVFSNPYQQPPTELSRYDQLKPREFFNAGGVSHYSCSS